jgi:hypothetical protein
MKYIVVYFIVALNMWAAFVLNGGTCLNSRMFKVKKRYLYCRGLYPVARKVLLFIF